MGSYRRPWGSKQPFEFRDGRHIRRPLKNEITWTCYLRLCLIGTGLTSDRRYFLCGVFDHRLSKKMSSPSSSATSCAQYLVSHLMFPAFFPVTYPALLTSANLFTLRSHRGCKYLAPLNNISITEDYTLS